MLVFTQENLFGLQFFFVHSQGPHTQLGPLSLLPTASPRPLQSWAHLGFRLSTWRLGQRDKVLVAWAVARIGLATFRTGKFLQIAGPSRTNKEASQTSESAEWLSRIYPFSSEGSRVWPCQACPLIESHSGHPSARKLIWVHQPGSG